MKRYVPKTYGNHRILRIVVRITVTAVLAAVILFIVLFFWLRQYFTISPDGVPNLDIPWLSEEVTE